MTTSDESSPPLNARRRWRRVVARFGFAAAWLPFVFIVLLGVRAQHAGDRIVWHGTHTVVVVATSPSGIAVGADIGDCSKLPRPDGRLSYERGVADAFAYEMTAVLALSVSPADTLYNGRRAGVAWYRFVPRKADYSINRFAAPTWLLALVTGTPPLAWWAVGTLRDSRRRRRQSRGLCPYCGYDLRGSPGRCPECGSAAGGVAPESLDSRISAPRTAPREVTLSYAAGAAQRKGEG